MHCQNHVFKNVLSLCPHLKLKKNFPIGFTRLIFKMQGNSWTGVFNIPFAHEKPCPKTIVVLGACRTNNFEVHFMPNSLQKLVKILLV